MDKIKLELTPVDLEEVKLSKDLKVLVKSYIDISTQLRLIELYLEAYFKKDENSRFIRDVAFDYYGAERTLEMAMIDMQTNIDVPSLDFDLFCSNGYLDIIIKNISNYYMIRDYILETVENKKKEELYKMSLDGIKSFILEFLSEITKTLSSDDLRTQLSALQESVKGSPLESIMKESALVSTVPATVEPSISKTPKSRLGKKKTQ